MTLRLRVLALAAVSFALLAAGQSPEDPAVVSAATSADSGATPAGELAFAPEIDEPEIAIGTDAPARLAALVRDSNPVELTGELKCLATAVYFEARGEPLEGQLAVAQVILNRVESGRFASSICGVVYQPNQFTFAHSRLPAAASSDWRVAQAIATIAQGASWHAMAPKAMNFHAVRVAPNWSGMRKVSQIGNHIFYR